MSLKSKTAATSSPAAVSGGGGCAGAGLKRATSSTPSTPERGGGKTLKKANTASTGTAAPNAGATDGKPSPYRADRRLKKVEDIVQWVIKIKKEDSDTP
jgi:hypothetical protein